MNTIHMKPYKIAYVDDLDQESVAEPGLSSSPKLILTFPGNCEVLYASWRLAKLSVSRRRRLLAAVHAAWLYGHRISAQSRLARVNGGNNELLRRAEAEHLYSSNIYTPSYPSGRLPRLVPVIMCHCSVISWTLTRESRL